MKDTVLNTVLSTSLVVAILFIAFDPGNDAPQSELTQAASVATMEKTVVTARRLANS